MSLPCFVSRSFHKRGLATALAFLAWAHCAVAEDPQLQFTKVSSMHSIVDIANAGDGSRRLFLVQQQGRIFILRDGETVEQPFLDISDAISSGGERGLLSLAFAPDYATSGYFYLWFTLPSGNTAISRYRVSDDPDIADSNSEERILTVSQPYANHNGGRLQFGPDGMLYLGLGDGGGANDPDENAQDGSTLLGKLIRIDVDPAHGTYAIPPDNPFVGNGSVLDEIWALGLRNPWRTAFDDFTGDLYIADVGQGALEEVNFQAADSTGGENYGWDIMEGTDCVLQGCNQSGLTKPVAEYTHADGCSITGGEVYRGNAYPNLHGRYLFGDYCSGKVWGLENTEGGWNMTLLGEPGLSISTFGLGEDRSVYVADKFTGVFLISDGEVKAEAVNINQGFSDAWYNPDTDGQGFYIIVFPDIGRVVVAWFTYDTELPPEDAVANLGDPGQRWFSALTQYSGNQAMGTIRMASGGIFDTPTEVSRVSDGTIILTFTSCNSGTVEYDIPSIERSGTVPIERITGDNIALCEALATY